MTSYFRNGGLNLSHANPAYGSRIIDSSAEVLYVSSDTGVDAVSHGRSRLDPFRTIEYAASTVYGTSGVTIIVLEGHVERMSGDAIQLSPLCCVRGEGAGDSRPAISQGDDKNSIFDIGNGVAGVEISGIRFVESHGYRLGSSRVAIGSGSNGTVFSECDFLFGELDAFTAGNSGISTQSSVEARDCLFKLTYDTSVTVYGSIPPGVLGINCGVSGITARIVRCIFDGGSVGWNDVDYNPFYVGAGYLIATGNVLRGGAHGVVGSSVSGIFTARSTGAGDLDWGV
jgi:hypothetical protein